MLGRQARPHVIRYKCPTTDKVSLRSQNFPNGLAVAGETVPFQYARGPNGYHQALEQGEQEKKASHFRPQHVALQMRNELRRLGFLKTDL